MAAKKDTERRATERRAPPRTTPNTAKPSAFNDSARADISADELRKLISEAAYYRAKRRGFAPGHELEDWVQAEAEVIGRLSSPGTSH
ncbi:MAG TPA: DUF2934 domain-containing protein [Burkholderiales bacterium]|jgi:hypothetical protein